MFHVSHAAFRSPAVRYRSAHPESTVSVLLCLDVPAGAGRLSGAVSEYGGVAGNHQRGGRSAHAQPENEQRGPVIA